MDRTPNQQTTKMHPASLLLLRQIAQHTGEKQVAVLHRLLAREWRRLQRTAPQKAMPC
jgi:hypothetical protein